MKKFIYLFIFLLFLPVVYGIEKHDVIYTIDDVVKVEHNIITFNELFVELIVPEDAYNFNILINGEHSDFNFSRIDNSKNVIIPLTSNSQNVEVYYSTSYFLDKGKHSYFVGLFHNAQSTERLYISLILPEQALLARNINALNPPVNPYPTSIDTTGRQLIINWVQENVTAGHKISFFVVYEGKANNLGYLIFMIVSILIIITMFILYINSKKGTIQNNLHLLEPEQHIFSILQKAKENVMWQKELQIATGFTKSKLSRTIRNMEQRGFIKKIPYGATNKIQLILKSENKEEESFEI